jgi:hypothetical protein
MKPNVVLDMGPRVNRIDRHVIMFIMLIAAVATIWNALGRRPS